MAHDLPLLDLFMVQWIQPVETIVLNSGHIWREREEVRGSVSKRYFLGGEVKRGGRSCSKEGLQKSKKVL